MGFFRKLAKNVKDKAALQDQSVSIEKLPADAQKSAGGIGSMLGGMTKRKKNPNVEAFYNSPMYKNYQDSGGIGTMDMYTASDGSIFGSGTVGGMYEQFLKDQAASKTPPAPTGIEALIRPERTDPNNQQDMQRLMDMQRQTFRSFLAPPPSDVVIQPGPYFPIDGGDLGLPMNPGTPAPGGVIFEGEVGGTPINIQEILDSLPKGVGVGGIGNIPIPDIPYEIPQLTAPQLPVDLPFQLPPELEQQIAAPQLPIDLPLQLPQIENLAVPQLPIDLPFQLPPELEQQIAVPQLPLELPLQLPQIQEILDSLPKGVGVGSVGNIAVPNIPAGLPAIKLPLETPSVNAAAMPAIQALNEVAVPKVKTAIPTYNYNDPERLARRDAYFASSRFD